MWYFHCRCHGRFQIPVANLSDSRKTRIDMKPLPIRMDKDYLSIGILDIVVTVGVMIVVGVLHVIFINIYTN